MLLERRGVDAHDIDAVIEILPEPSLSHHFAEVLVGGENQACPQRDEPVAAEPAELALLQNPQKLDLRAQAKFADFVEKQRTVARLLQIAFARTDGAGKSAFFVAEQLGFDQRFGDGAAADGDKGRSERVPRLWMALAISSLPVPLSPVTSTEALRLATRRTRS